MEYRYWGFIEGHPAHIQLPSDRHTEAMDALKWSYTGEPDSCSCLSRYILLTHATQTLSSQLLSRPRLRSLLMSARSS